MAHCELLQNCTIIEDIFSHMPSAADTVRKLYCSYNYAQCARHKIATELGRDKIPYDLFPGDLRRAEYILIQHDKK